MEGSAAGRDAGATEGSGAEKDKKLSESILAKSDLSLTYTKEEYKQRLDKLQKSTRLDIRVFEDAITFRIALMVVKYMNYMENMEY